jgi:DNA-binding CsgD family transcriptional regulator
MQGGRESEALIERATALSSKLINDDFLKASLPNKPYCSNDLDYGLKIRPRDIALNHKYLQPNNPHSKQWLVYDVDRDTDCGMDWADRGVTPPNFAVVNPENGHAHYVYILTAPVYTQRNTSLKAQYYLQAIDEALNKKLGADKNYSKLITKNPFHESWQYYPFQYNTYSLKEIAEGLVLKRKTKENLKTEDAKGRNCTLFEAVRHFGYRISREEGWNEQSFYQKIEEHSLKLNQDFWTESIIPMTIREVQGIAKSIATWCWKHLAPKWFRQWADERRANSLKVRQKKMNERREELKEILEKEPFLSTKKLAEQLGCSESTIRNDLKALGEVQPPQFVISDSSQYGGSNNYASEANKDDEVIKEQESIITLSEQPSDNIEFENTLNTENTTLKELENEKPTKTTDSFCDSPTDFIHDVSKSLRLLLAKPIFRGKTDF